MYKLSQDKSFYVCSVLVVMAEVHVRETVKRHSLVCISKVDDGWQRRNGITDSGGAPAK